MISSYSILIDATPLQHHGSSTSTLSSSSSSSYSSTENRLRSKPLRSSPSDSSSSSFLGSSFLSCSSSSSSRAMTSKRRMAAMPVMFLSRSPEGWRLEKMTVSPPNFLTWSQSLLMTLRFSKSLLRKRQSLMSSFWTACIWMQRKTSCSPQAIRFSFFCMMEQNSSRTFCWLMALVFSILLTTNGSASTSFRLCRYPFEHFASTILLSHRVLPLSPSFSSSVRMYRSSWSLMKPGLAITKHLMRSKSRVRMAMQHSWKNLPRDLRQISSPQLFLEMDFSIFFLSRVMDCLTQQRCATPSSITMAAISSPCSSLASSRIRLISQFGHSSLQIVSLEFSSISKVWYCPIFRKSLSRALRPLMLMQSRSSFAKQEISTICRVSMMMRVRIFLRPVTLESSMILRLVLIRMWSPFWMRLQMCHRSSSSVATTVTYPSPHAFLMLLRSMRISFLSQRIISGCCLISHSIAGRGAGEGVEWRYKGKAKGEGARVSMDLENWIGRDELGWGLLEFIIIGGRMMIKGRFQILKGYQNNHVTIGFGSYGQVKLARDVTNGEVVAVKVINKIAKNEVMMHYGLAHPKIIKLLDVHIDSEREITYMMLEYAEGGTLYDKIKMTNVPKLEIRRYFKDVCEGLAYLHSQNIMHRDIKPENILLTKSNEAKLCDFGFAAILGERKTLCGTYEYMSPEMIQNRPYDYKIDIWAVGILLFELIAGHAPFKGDKPEEVLEQMKTKIYFCERFDVEDIAIIKTILRVTSHKRPTIGEILEQSYFRMDDKHDELTTRSTTNTEDSKAKNSTFQYLNESCNPRKMGELQKMLDKEPREQPKDHQKQTYPPFYVPKTIQKFGVGVSVPSSEHKEVKSYSPLHSSKPQFGVHHSGYSPGNSHSLTMNYYKPSSQPFCQANINKSLNTLPSKGQTQGQGQDPKGPNNQTLNHPPNGGFTGFGRFS